MTQDHDILIECRNDLRHMRSWTESHTADDEKKHSQNIDRFKEINGALESLKEFRWKSTAAVGCILIGIDLLFKWFHK